VVDGAAPFGRIAQPAPILNPARLVIACAGHAVARAIGRIGFGQRSGQRLTDAIGRADHLRMGRGTGKKGEQKGSAAAGASRKTGHGGALRSVGAVLAPPLLSGYSAA